MDDNYISNYLGENEECSKAQSLEKIVASVIEILVEDEAKDDSALFRTNQ